MPAITNPAHPNAGKSKDMGRYLVVVADDMGSSTSVNQAIVQAHDNGFLTAASLMAGGDAFDNAVKIALDRSRLSTGLHVTLCDGKAVLPHRLIPDITDHEGEFLKDPFTAGLLYTKPRLLSQIEKEVDAQFDRLERAGLRPSHVDGHHHLHMHPVIFRVICRQASARGVSWIRIPNEPLSAVTAFRSPDRGILPFAEWAVFGMLGKYNTRAARRHGMRSAVHVWGLARSGSADEQFFLDVLKSTGEGVNEVFTHPDADTARGRQELAALVSPRVRDLIKELNISPAGYRDFGVSLKAQKLTTENTGKIFFYKKRPGKVVERRVQR
jgi:hopanoid biosynthesis associated protein HpnK